MPKCSEQWKRLHFLTQDNRCFDCKLTGFINTPYTYNEKDLHKLENDFYFALEPKATNPLYYHHDIIISQRLRQKLIENGITDIIKGREGENYKSRDWTFQPIICLNNS